MAISLTHARTHTRTHTHTHTHYYMVRKEQKVIYTRVWGAAQGSMKCKDRTLSYILPRPTLNCSSILPHPTTTFFVLHWIVQPSYLMLSRPTTIRYSRTYYKHLPYHTSYHVLHWIVHPSYFIQHWNVHTGWLNNPV